MTKSDLRKFFRRYSRASLVLPVASGNLYEFFAFLTACDEALAQGVGVTMAAPGGTYKVRASPGALGGNFGYVELRSASGAVYELHNGIEIDGQSGMYHEADLLLLAAPGTAPGLTSRAALRQRQLMWTAECKRYGSSSRLKGESRKAVGAVLDWSQSAHASTRNGRAQGCIHCRLGFHACFVTNVSANLRPDIEYFLGAYEIEPCFGTRGNASGTFRSHVASVMTQLP